MDLALGVIGATVGLWVRQPLRLGAPPRVQHRSLPAALLDSPVADVLLEEDGVHIELEFNSDVRHFLRKRSEPLERTTKRMAKSLKVPPKRVVRARNGSTAQQEREAPYLRVQFLDSAGRALQGHLSLGSMFAFGMAVALVVGRQRFRIRVDRPIVKQVNCFGCPLVGVPLYPDALGRGSTADKMRWEWWRVRGEELVGSERVYTPREEDSGSPLRVVARPPGVEGPQGKALGVDEDVASAHWVSEPTQSLTSDAGRSKVRSEELSRRRAAWLNGRSSVEIMRVVSYNVLADAYRHFWETMFPYCDPEFTRPDVRLQLCMCEIAKYNADIVCLQEVDIRQVDPFWRPQLVREGFHVHHTKKGGNSAEGLALCVRRSRFELLELRELYFANRPRPVSQGPAERAVGQLLEANPGLYGLWARLTTVAQLAAVRTRGPKPRTLLVVNAHLFFASPARSVRAMQMTLLLEEALRMAKEYGSPPLVLAGDLNSTPDTLTMELLLRGKVPASHVDWVTGSVYHRSYASARGAAFRLSCALNAEDTEAALRELTFGARPEDMGVLLERLARARGCWAVLRGHGGAEAEAEDEEEAPPSQPSTAASGKYPGLQAALLGGATFKDNAVVARAQFALDTGLSLDNPWPAQSAAAEALARLTAAAQEAVEAAAEAQAAVVSAASTAGADVDGAAGAAADAQGASGATLAAATDKDIKAQLTAAVRGLGLDIEHPFNLASALATTPEFTNFVDGYVATLDWILYDKDSLQRVADAPLPSRADVEEFTALPSRNFPSDHLLLAADLAWGSAQDKQ